MACDQACVGVAPTDGAVLADATGLLAPIEMAEALEDLCARIVAEMAIKMGMGSHDHRRYPNGRPVARG